MNQIAAYQGFPVRLPAWKWGWSMSPLSKRDAPPRRNLRDLVINTDPVYAYLQESNAVVDRSW